MTTYKKGDIIIDIRSENKYYVSTVVSKRVLIVRHLDGQLLSYVDTKNVRKLTKLELALQ
jgi:hypothetical protein